MRREWKLLLAFWVLILLVLSPPCRAADRVWMHYGNSPPWQDAIGWDSAVLSPRAIAQADSLSLRGVEVRVWVQPFASTWKGQPVRNWPWDFALWNLLDTFGPARYANGDTVFFSQDDVSGVVLIDFSRTDVTDAWIALVRSLDRPVLLDYGCRSMSWAIPSLSTPYWQAWATGWAKAKSALAPLVQCQSWQEGASGIALERIGGSLNPVSQVWEMARRHPTLLLLSSSDPKLRRVTATIALLTDAGMNWGHATSDLNRKPLELFELQIGDFYAPAWERDPGVWMRLATTGGVLLNFSGSSYRWGPYTIEDGDGFVFQRPSWADGQVEGFWDNNQGR